jgi:hypothetical protein
LFLLFGLWLLFDSALGLRWLAAAVTGAVATAAVIAAAIRFVRNRRSHTSAPVPLGSQNVSSRSTSGYCQSND